MLSGVALLAFTAKVFIPLSQSEILLDNARSAAQRGDFTSAEEMARQASKLDPANSDVHTLIGKLRESWSPRRGENISLALKAYEDALELDCWNRNAMEGLWRIYNTGRPPKLEETLVITIRLLSAYPTSSRYNIMAGGLYERMGRTIDAIIHYRMALYIDDHVEQHGAQLSADEREKTTTALWPVSYTHLTLPTKRIV